MEINIGDKYRIYYSESRFLNSLIDMIICFDMTVLQIIYSKFLFSFWQYDNKQQRYTETAL